MLWDLSEGKHLESLDAGGIIYALCFSPNRYWLCAATDIGIRIWDLESKSVVADLTKARYATLLISQRDLRTTSCLPAFSAC